jgi:hypothetical protein
MRSTRSIWLAVIDLAGRDLSGKNQRSSAATIRPLKPIRAFIDPVDRGVAHHRLGRIAAAA